VETAATALPLKLDSNSRIGSSVSILILIAAKFDTVVVATDRSCVIHATEYVDDDDELSSLGCV